MDTLTAALIALEENKEKLRGQTGPAGQDGEQGPPGIAGRKGDPGLVWRGSWNSGTAYKPDDAVESEGSSYVAVGPSKGDKPPAGSWNLLAKKGDDGRDGPPTRGNGIRIQDEGVAQGTVHTINAVGSGIAASVVGDIATLTVSGGGGGGGSSPDVTDGSTTVSAPGIHKFAGSGASVAVTESPAGTAVVTITADASGAAAAAQSAAATDATTKANAAQAAAIAASDASGAAAAAQAASQPLDSDLTAIAALSTTSFGRSLLTTANAAGLISTAGLDADLATLSVGASASVSGTNTGDQTNISGNAATVTTNANLTGDVTSSGNATTIGAGKVTEAMQVLADNTTQNVSTSKHGYAPKSPNDATKYLDGTGAYSVPSGGSAGAMVLLEQHTASAQATLDFTAFISSTYDEYVFEGLNIAPATDQANLLFRVGTGGGPTYDAGANYYGSAYTDLCSNGTSAKTNLDAAASANMLVKNIGNASGGYANAAFSFRFVSPQSTTVMKYSHGTATYHDGIGVFMGRFGGLWASLTAATAVRFLFSSGNIASGVIRVYGIAK